MYLPTNYFIVFSGKSKPSKPSDKQQDKHKTLKRLIMMSFTPLQVQALKQLFAMTPEAREVAFTSTTLDSGTFLQRTNSLDNLQSAFSTPPPNKSHGSSDNDSIASTSSQRIHHKNASQKLSSFLSKNYFSAVKVWEYLYKGNNRISNSRLERILDQLKDKLNPSQQKTLKTDRKTVIKYLKKKIAAGRNYRKKLLKSKGKILEAPLSKAIDLTRSDDEEEQLDDADNETPVEGSNDGDLETVDKNKGKVLTQKFKEKIKELRDSRNKAVVKSQSTSRKRKTRAQTTNSESPSKKKNTSSRWRDRQMEACPTFKKGSRVMGMWKGPDCKGDWYEGVVKSVNKRKKTAYVVYDDGDGDCDRALKWVNMRVIEP